MANTQRFKYEPLTTAVLIALSARVGALAQEPQDSQNQPLPDQASQAEQASPAQQAQQIQKLPRVQVTANAYQDEPASTKYTAPLLDTPQTITIVPQQVIEDQNLLGLTQILSTLPGITFGAGEAAGGRRANPTWKA